MRFTWLIGILMLLTVGCASDGSGDRTSNPTPIATADVAKLEQLVTRLYTQPAGVLPKYEGTPHILVGELPLDFGVRLPDGANIFGSVVHSNNSFQAVVDLPLDRSEGEAFFVAALAEAGWRDQRDPDEAGFITSSNYPLGYCSGGDILLYIFLSDSPVENFTEARISATNLDNLPRSVCEEDEDSVYPADGEMAYLPTLKAPAGVISLGGQASAVNQRNDPSRPGPRASIEITLSTEISAADLEEYYREQLDGLDWELLEQGTMGPVAASTWRFTDEAGEGHLGLLWVVEGPGVDWRTAFLEVTRPVK